MRATVHEGTRLSARIAGDDDRRIAEMGGLEIAGIGQFRFEREEVPDRAAEDPGLLARVDIRIVIDLVGGATIAFGGPLQ